MSYRFSDVIKSYENGYTGAFINMHTDTLIKYGEPITYIPDRDASEWLVLNPVPVEVGVAIQALKNGKSIYCKDSLRSDMVYAHYNSDYRDRSSVGQSINLDELFKKYWFIKEE